LYVAESLLLQMLILTKKILKYLHQNKVSLNFVVIGAIACIQALNTIILGRILSEENFGLFSFLFSSIVPLVSLAVILGQNTSVVRYFSKHNFTDFKWKRYFTNISSAFLVLISIIVLVICIFYRLSTIYYIYLCLAIFSSAILTFVAGFFRSRKRFLTAVFLERISPPIFLILIGLSFILNLHGLKYIVTLKTVSYLAPFSIVIFLFLIKKKNGHKNVEKHIYSDGILLWGLGLTLIAINRFDGFFIVKFIDYKAIAVYSILLAFVQIYDFAAQAIWSVYFQKFSSQYKPNLLRFVPKIGIIAALISLFYLIIGKSLLHLLFNGKYDHGIYLLLPFCIIGCLKLLYIYPSCYLVGKSSSKMLKSFLNVNILGAVLKIVLLVLGIKYFGLLGAALSGIIVWIYRNVVGFYLITKDNERGWKVQV